MQEQEQAPEKQPTSIATSSNALATESQLVRLDQLSLPSFLDFKWIENMKHMKLRPDDIWIVTYPKCGTTWTQQIVRLIINKGHDYGVVIEEAVPWVEGFSVLPNRGFKYYVDVDKMTSPRAFKSHFPYAMMPCGLPCNTLGRYINVIRNPKDVAVSYFHHYNSYPYYPNYEWSKFIDLFINGELEYGDYFDHVLSWWAHKDDDNVLILKYEDMKKDLPSAVATIATFIDQDISKELVEEIAHKTTFENMRRDSLANYEQLRRFKAPTRTDFMRKGDVGDWKNYFTSEQSARLDAAYDEKMKGSGINFKFYIN